MINLSFDPAKPLSKGTIHGIVKEALKQNFNGVGTISFLLGEEMKLLCLGGEISEILLNDKNHKLHLAGERFESLFEPSRLGYLRMQAAPNRLLMFERACFDGQVKETRRHMPTAELGKFFAAQEKHESATLLKLQWYNAQAYVLIPGAGLTLRRAIFITGDQIETDEAALASLLTWKETSCEMNRYQGALESDAWILLHLNILFEFTCAHQLKQYGYLTGRTIVNSMIRNLLFAAPQFGFELTANDGSIQDQTVFKSIAEAGNAYTSILDYLEKQIESMVGSNFRKIVKNQGLELLNSFYINLARYYGFQL